MTETSQSVAPAPAPATHTPSPSASPSSEPQVASTPAIGASGDQVAPELSHRDQVAKDIGDRRTAQREALAKANAQPANGATGDPKAGAAKPEAIPANETPEAKADRERRANGQYAAKGQAPADGKLAPPQTWPKELSKEAWDKTDPAVQAAIVEQNRKASRLLSDAGRMRQEVAAQAQRAVQESERKYSALNSVISQHADTLGAWQVNVPQFIDNQVKRVEALNRDPYTAIAQLAKEYNVDLSLYAQDYDPNNLPDDPRVRIAEVQLAAAQRQIEEKNRIIGLRDQSSAERERMEAEYYAEAQAQAEQQQTYNSTFETVNEYWQGVEDADILGPLVLDLLPGKMATHRSPGDALLAAVNDARRMSPELQERQAKKRSVDAETKRRQTEAQYVQTARNAGAVNVGGRSPISNQPQTIRDVQRAAFRRAGGDGAAA